ncbi:hypothetical protein [Streptomyces sp. DG1A-41]|uniref:hypothetical protein n=1 Tax=Streptomyces sp. DG1A-41 TaxID=3125779 RepID=UPI0030CCDD68
MDGVAQPPSVQRVPAATERQGTHTPADRVDHRIGPAVSFQAVQQPQDPVLPHPTAWRRGHAQPGPHLRIPQTADEAGSTPATAPHQEQAGEDPPCWAAWTAHS